MSDEELIVVDDEYRDDDTLDCSYVSSNKTIGIRNKSVEFSSQENAVLVDLYCDNRALYHAKLNGSSRNGPTAQDRLAAEWAAEISNISGELRTTSQIKQRIYDLKKRALKEIDREKKERSRTGGGKYKSSYVPHWLRKLMEHVGTDDSVVGIRNGAESGRENSSVAKEESSPERMTREEGASLLPQLSEL